MSRSTKLITALRVESSTSFWVSSTGGSPYTEVALTAGLYYILPSGGLLGNNINSALSALGAPWEDLEFTVDSSGIVTATNNSGATNITIHWGDPDAQGSSALDVQRWLRMDDQTNPYTLNFGTSDAGYRVHVGGFYPDSYLQADLEVYRPRAAIMVPDSGNAQVLKVARRKEYSLTIRSTGFPRASGYSEYQEFVDWHDEATSGRPFRLYADTSVTAAYAAPSTRYGYQSMILDPQPLDLQPEQGNYYKHFQHNLTAHEYSE